MEIGPRVQARRRAQQMTQAELAAELGVTPQYISALEGGTSTPAVATLARLAAVLGVTTDFLLTGRESAPVDIAGAIRAQHDLSPAAKKTLIGLVALLRTPAGPASGA